MRFIWTQALWLFLALPCVVGVYIVAWRRRHSALRYPSIRLVREAIDTRNRLRPHIPALFLLGALVLCLIAIARPAAIVTTPSQERTIMLAIDVSLSMAAEDIKPSRLQAAQAAAKAFIASQPADVRIGVVAFAGHAYLMQPPTVDHPKASIAIDRLQLQHNTAVGSGLLAALITLFPDDRFADNYDIFGSGSLPVAGDPLRLDRDQAAAPALDAAPAPGAHPSAAIVILTDGADNAGMPSDKAAQFAAERGVRVYTVGFGKPGTTQTLDGKAMEVGFDEAALKRIAADTRGEYFSAATAQKLNHVYHDLQSRIVLRKTGMELSALFAAAAAILVLIAGGLSLAWCAPIVTRARVSGN